LEVDLIKILTTKGTRNRRESVIWVREDLTDRVTKT
jgi:hypothetical protein